MDSFARIKALKNLDYIKASDYVTIDDLFLKDENGEDYFDYIIKNKIIIDNEALCHDISNDYNLLKRAAENGYFLKRYDNIDLLFQGSGETIIEIMIYNIEQRNVTFPHLDICTRLFEKTRNGYLFNKLLNEFNKPKLFKEIIGKINDFDTLYNCLSDIGRLDLMLYAKPEFLIKKMPNGVTILQDLINRGVDLRNVNIEVNNPQIADILYQNGLYKEMLAFVKNDILVNYPSLENSYLNGIVRKFKEENISVDVIKVSDNRSLAIIYLKFIENGLKLPSDIKLFPTNQNYTEKPFFAYMLEINRDLTLEYFANNQSLRSAAIRYISKLRFISKKFIDEFNITDFLSYLPTKEDIFKTISEGKPLPKVYCIEDLIEPMENGVIILEYMIKHGIDIYGIKTKLLQNFQAIMIMIKNHYAIDSIEKDMLFEDIGNNQKLIDLLMKEGYYNCIASSSKGDLRIVEYCLKYDCYNSISNSILEALFVNNNGHFVVEKYLANPKFFDFILKSIEEKRIYLDDNKIIQLFNKGYKPFIMFGNEELLWKRYKFTTYFEYLLKNNQPIHPRFEFKSLNTLALLYKYKRPDLMVNADLKLLVDYPSYPSNYLQYIISCAKKGMDVKLEKKKFSVCDHKTIAKCYIQLAQNGILGYAETLNNTSLLASKDAEDHSLLYYLLTLDKDITLHKILNPTTMRDPKVFAELKELGVSDISMSVSRKFDKFECDRIYIQLKNEEYAEGIDSPIEDLLAELRDIFMQDGKSDQKLIDALITSYRYITSINPMFIEEVKALIEIKKKNPDFKYSYSRNGSDFFSRYSGIFTRAEIISTLNHETGHALHYYLTSDTVPDKLGEIIERVRKDPQFIQKVSQYFKNFRMIRRELSFEAEAIVSKYITSSSINGSSSELSALLDQEKEKVREIYRAKGYTDETLDIILSKSFTIEEFVKQKKEIEKGELIDLILRYDYDVLAAISDIIDAITGGKLHSKLLKDDKGEDILQTYGHGIRYYTFGEEYVFGEMIANYSLIIKSKKSEKALQILRDIVGDELVDLLDDFYKSKILKLSPLEDSKKINL